MGKVHKRLTDDQVNGRIERYLRKDIEGRRSPTRQASLSACYVYYCHFKSGIKMKGADMLCYRKEDSMQLYFLALRYLPSAG